MFDGQFVSSQVLDFLPRRDFNACVERYRGNYKCRGFSCRDQFLVMAFAQLTYRESLRDIEICLRALGTKLYHAGLRSKISRSTMADANQRRDWRIYADFAHILIRRARVLYAKDTLAVDLEETAYALDSTTIDLCLSLFPWARFQPTKAAVKLHTLLDLRGNIPCFVHVLPGKVHDVNVLDRLLIEPAALYVMDRAYIDYHRLRRFTTAGAFFVTRTKSNLRCTVREKRPVDRRTGLRSDHTIVLNGVKTAALYPEPLRRVAFYAVEHKRRLVFLTNNFALPALTIAGLDKSRWQIELFFKWIKQHLRIKAFFGTSENAVKTQIWIAISVYVLVAIVKKELRVERSLYEILQVLSLTLFEKTPLFQSLQAEIDASEQDTDRNQLKLFDL
ncbi:MAG: IS4 family transposase [Planctomycetia bacterium]